MTENMDKWQKRVIQRIRIEMAIRQLCPNCTIQYNPQGSEWDMQIKINDKDLKLAEEMQERLWVEYINNKNDKD